MNEPITIIGEANHRNQLRRFGIKQDDRRRHMYIIGKTGMGKSVMLQNLTISDIHAGHGVCFIDPHGDAAEELLEFIPPHRINDVIYFNPADLDYPVAFNIFETVDQKYKHLVASGLVAVFKKMWADSWGPRLEYILRNTILALLDFPSATLLGVPRMLVDKQYRRKVVAKITDPVVKAFWVEEFENYNDRFMVEAISPIQNKVGQFLSSAVIRNILGQPKSTIDLEKAMNENKILILNLSKGKLGEDNSALIGAMMITKVQLAAMQRAQIAEEDRKDFYLYVDEFQNFATEAFATVLSEARKYRLNLIVANQYIAQMEETVADAVFGNVGTMIVFRVGAADAEMLEKEFEPVFMMNDLVNLPKYNIYLKLMVDGVATRAFSAQTLPIIYEQFNLAEKVIDISRERYGRPRAEVEEKITRWSGVEVVTGGNEAEMQAQMESRQAAVPVAEEDTEEEPPADAEEAFATLPQQNQPPAPQPAQEAPQANEEAQQPVAQHTKVMLPSELEKQKQAQNKKKKKGKKPVDPDRTMYKTQCDECEIPIEVPFEPDGSRPVLCQDCLPEYRSRMAKIENQKSVETGGNARQQDKPKVEPKQDKPQPTAQPEKKKRRPRPPKKNLSEAEKNLTKNVENVIRPPKIQRPKKVEQKTPRHKESQGSASRIQPGETVQFS